LKLFTTSQRDGRHAISYDEYCTGDKQREETIDCATQTVYAVQTSFEKINSIRPGDLTEPTELSAPKWELPTPH
jgi:hypothetical protein